LSQRPKAKDVLLRACIHGFQPVARGKNTEYHTRALSQGPNAKDNLFRACKLRTLVSTCTALLCDRAWRRFGTSARPTSSFARAPTAAPSGDRPRQQRLKSELIAKFEGGSSHFSFKAFAPGAFNVGSIGSTCTALPGGVWTDIPETTVRVGRVPVRAVLLRPLQHLQVTAHQGLRLVHFSA
jgi:hypothetical protein